MAISEKVLGTQLAALGQRLRQLRLHANVTQKVLSERTGVALKTIGNAEESGRMSMETFVRLLDGLGRGDELETLLHGEITSPIDLLRRGGQLRERASRSKTRRAKRSHDWTW